MSRKIISLVLSICFIFQQTGLAQAAAVELNLSGYFARMASSMDVDRFRPIHLRYFSYDSLNNSFKVLLDKGDFDKDLSPQEIAPEVQTKAVEDKLKEETKVLLNYFLIGITLPNDKFWVNLRPDSTSQIIDFNLEETDIGKIMLEADLQLKKDTAQFTSPQTPEGKEYWNRLYKKAEEIYGTENITIPTLTRPWIVPNEIIVREAKDSAYIYKATLKVMLEQDYLKDSSAYNFKDSRAKALNEYSSQLIRELIIPKLTKEVNLSKRYAPLRQVYYSLILSRWFKSRFYGKSGVYASLIDKNDLTNLTSKDTWSKSTYFNAYKKSFADGEYNIKEPVYTPSGQTIRSYFSGGMDLTGKAASPMVLNGPRFIVGNDLAVILSKRGWLSAGAKVVIGKPIEITFVRPQLLADIAERQKGVLKTVTENEEAPLVKSGIDKIKNTEGDAAHTIMGAASPVQSMKERIQELEGYIENHKSDIADLYKEISRNNEEMARLNRGSEREGTYLWGTPTNPFFTRELPNPTPKTNNLERINQNWYDQIERHNKGISAARSELEGLKKKIAQAISALRDLHVTIYQQKSKNLVSFQLSIDEKGSNAEALSFIYDFAKEEVQKITKTYQDELISNTRVPELSKIDTHVTLVFDYPYSTTSNFWHAESLTGAIAEKIHEDWRNWKQVNSAVAASPVTGTDETDIIKALTTHVEVGGDRISVSVDVKKDIGELDEALLTNAYERMKLSIRRTKEKSLELDTDSFPLGPMQYVEALCGAINEIKGGGYKIIYLDVDTFYIGRWGSSSKAQTSIVLAGFPKGASSAVELSIGETADFRKIIADLETIFSDLSYRMPTETPMDKNPSLVFSNLKKRLGITGDLSNHENFTEGRITAIMEFVGEQKQAFANSQSVLPGLEARFNEISDRLNKLSIGVNTRLSDNWFAPDISTSSSPVGDISSELLRLLTNDTDSTLGSGKQKQLFIAKLHEIIISLNKSMDVWQFTLEEKVKTFIAFSEFLITFQNMQYVIKEAMGGHAESYYNESIITEFTAALNKAGMNAKHKDAFIKGSFLNHLRLFQELVKQDRAPLLPSIAYLEKIALIIKEAAQTVEINAMVADIGYKLKNWTEGLLKYLSQAEAKQPGLKNQVESVREYYKYYVDKELIKASSKLLYDILQGSQREAGLIGQLTGITQHPGIFLKNLKATQDLIEDLKLKAARLREYIGAEPAGASSAVDEKGPVGGIDFKHQAMASATTYEAMGSFVGLDFSLPKLSSQALLSFNLDKEQSNISQAIDNGIIVSGQRIKEFMAASAVKGGLEQRRETVITWLAKLGILEETTCCTQESSKEYREALVIADSAVI